jgi:hypothetical protein
MVHRTAKEGAKPRVFGQLALIWAVLLCCATVARGQGYLLQAGAPSFTTAEPVELGYLDLSNSDLHLEVPLASPGQRGSLQYGAALV